MTLGSASIKRLGILISGRGSNMVALADAVRDGRIPNAEIAIVISDQPNAAGLAKARERGIESRVIERRGRTRAEHDREIVSALNAGAKVSGCTVHFVDETLDNGPIIAQRTVPINQDDTVESLSARILIEEHKLYPEVVAMLTSGGGPSS